MSSVPLHRSQSSENRGDEIPILSNFERQDWNLIAIPALREIGPPLRRGRINIATCVAKSDDPLAICLHKLLTTEVGSERLTLTLRLSGQLCTYRRSLEVALELPDSF